MVRSPRTLMVLGVLLLSAVVLAGNGLLSSSRASAQQAGGDATASPARIEELLERLDELERVLPDSILPVSFSYDRPLGNATAGGDALELRRRLDPLEQELRDLYAAADDTRHPTAAAIAKVARGWLDVWQASRLLADVESHDLAFPTDTRTLDGVATGADDVVLLVESAIDLVLDGHRRHLEGYVELRRAGDSTPAGQARLDSRAAASEDFDADIRPQLLALLSRPSTSVIATSDRFTTTQPGVAPRASSLEVVCVDRDALARAGGTLTDELRDELASTTRERADCPDPIDVDDPAHAIDDDADTDEDDASDDEDAQD